MSGGSYLRSLSSNFGQGVGSKLKGPGLGNLCWIVAHRVGGKGVVSFPQLPRVKSQRPGVPERATVTREDTTPHHTTPLRRWEN